eukprot:7391015-Prymnesium_polylepis.1
MAMLQDDLIPAFQGGLHGVVVNDCQQTRTVRRYLNDSAPEPLACCPREHADFRPHALLNTVPYSTRPLLKPPHDYSQRSGGGQNLPEAQRRDVLPHDVVPASGSL